MNTAQQPRTRRCLPFRILPLILAAVFLLSACGSAEDRWQEAYDRGVRFLEEGNFEEAAIAFQAAIELDPKRADAYIGLADALEGHGDVEEARKVLADALSVVEDATVIQTRLDVLDGKSPESPDSSASPGDGSSSASASTQTPDVSAEPAPTWQELYDKGMGCLQNADYAGAGEAFNGAIGLDATNAAAYIGLADAYVGQNAKDSAIQMLQNALNVVSDPAAIQSKLDEINPPPPPAPNPAELLASVTYYGDVSKCALTPAQAGKMAQTLQNWSGSMADLYGYDSYYREEMLSAYLCDADGSGMPALVIQSGAYAEDSRSMDGEFTSIYSWEAGELKKTVLVTSNMGAAFGHGYTEFGIRPDGKYGWSSEDAHSGDYMYQGYTLENGSIRESDLITMSDWQGVNVWVNDVPVFADEYDPDSDPDGSLMSQYMDRAHAKYDELTAPYRIPSPLEFPNGTDRNTVQNALNAFAAAG